MGEHPSCQEKVIVTMPPVPVRREFSARLYLPACPHVLMSSCPHVLMSSCPHVLMSAFKTETKFSLNRKVGDECGGKGNLSRSKYRARISKNPIKLALFRF